MSAPAAIQYGCAHAECGYRTRPTTMPDPDTRCPICGGPWIMHPPPQLADTGRVILERQEGSKHWKKIVVRPHLRHCYEQIQKDLHATNKGKRP